MKAGTKIGIGLGVFCAAGLGVAWWWTHNMVRRWEPHSVYLFSQDKYDYLALRRILERQGIRIEFRDHIGSVIGELRESDAVFLTTIPYGMPSALADSLLDWVGRGGMLLMDSPWDIDSTNDALTKPLGIHVRRPPKDSSATGEPGEPSTPDTLDASASPTETSTDGAAKSDSDTPKHIILSGLPEPTFDSLVDRPDPDEDGDPEETGSDTSETFRIDSGSAVRFPGGLEPLHISTTEYAPVIFSEPASNTIWRDSLDSTTLVVSHRRGFVAATTTIWRLSNLPIHDLDQAEFALKLLSWRQKPTRVWIVSEGSVVPWWLWTLARAWAVVLLGFLLAAAWVWNRSRRFGPALPVPETDHRPLLEHVDASARWIWNSPEGPETLVRALRASVRRHLSVRHPAWSRLPLQELSEELARLHGISIASVRRALGPEDPDPQTAPSPQELVGIVKILQKLKEHT